MTACGPYSSSCSWSDWWLADLYHADLQGANLTGADLTKAKGLTREQLDEACGDDETNLPDDLADYQMKACPTPEQPPSN